MKRILLSRCLLTAPSRVLLSACFCLSLLPLLPGTSRAQTSDAAQTPAAAQSASTLPASASEPTSYNLTSQMRSQDARLNTPVTLDAPRISLGELLDKLSEQSDVMLNTDTRDPISGLKLFVVCDKTPLGDLLDRLWSLLSFRDATWKWERTGKAGAYRYQFIQTRAAAGFPQRMKQLAQEAFEIHAANMIAIAALPPEERKKHIAEMSATMLQKDDVMAKRMTDKDWASWNSLRAFGKALTPPQQKSVLRGSSFHFMVEQLPEELRAAFHTEWAQSNEVRILPNGQRIPEPEPTAYMFERHAGLGIPSLISLMYITTAPVTHTDANGTSTGTSSMGVLGGGMEPGMRGKVEDLWILPGDSRSSALAERLCEKPATPIPDLPPTPKTIAEYEEASKQGRQFTSASVPLKFQHRFGQLAHALPAVILGVLPAPNDQGYDPTTPYNKPVKTFLAQAARNDEFTTRRDLLYKWRGDTLLVIYPTWYLDEERCYPYALAQQAQRAARNGFIPYRDLIQIAAQMTPEQWGDLCRNTPLLNDMEGALNLLQLCVVYPGLLRDTGLTLTDENRQALQHITNASQNRALQDDKATAIRARNIKRVLFGMNRSELQVQYLDADRKWKPLLEYAQKQAVQQ